MHLAPPDPWTATADGARHRAYAALAARGPVQQVRMNRLAEHPVRLR
jgi:hypothetical protein